MILPKLHFFATVANIIKPFLTCYQTTNPMAPFLYDDLNSFVCEIMSWFIKPTILQKVNCGSALFKLDLTDKENILSHNKINIGCGATKVINNKICTDTVTPSEISK